MKYFAALLFILIIVVFSGLVSAECQYKEEVIETVEELKLVGENGKVYGNPLTFKDFTTGKRAAFVVQNPLKEKIIVNISFENSADKRITVQETIQPLSFTIVDDISCCNVICFTNSCAVKQETLEYKVVYPRNMDEEFVNVDYPSEECRKCRGLVCSNDGFPCNNDYECGSGICNIANICGLTKIVDCPTGTLICNNKACLIPSRVEMGGAYSCDWECVSGHGEDGVCKEDPEVTITKQLDKEAEKAKQEGIRQDELQKELEQIEAQQIKTIITGGIIVFILAIIVTALVIYHKGQTRKHELTKIETEAVQLENLSIKLAQIKKERDELKKQKSQKKEDIRNLEVLNNKYEKIISDIAETEKEITRPHPDPNANNRLVVINPHLGGYKCFYDKKLKLEEYKASSLLHRWVWKKHHGRWPKKGCHIHHKDGKKYNNSIDNLEEIKGGEHFDLHRKN